MTIVFDWDDDKSALLKKTRGLSLEEVSKVFLNPYLEMMKNDCPEQWKVIGILGSRCLALVYEQRFLNGIEIYWIITFWDATGAERKLYDKTYSSFA